jgi:hypothetical protein
MITERVHIGIISHKRSANVSRMQELIGLPVTWYVGFGEKDDYINAGADSVIESGGLCESRNAILDHSFSENKYAVELSDDLNRVMLATAIGGNKKEGMLFVDAIQMMFDVLRLSPFYLAGVSPTDNPYFVTAEVSLNHFIVGDFIMVKPCELRFDTNLKLKEDYDFTVQHIKKYGGVVRVNRILATFKHYSNSGGAVSIRNDDKENESINYLFKKHPGFFKKNAKRKNEILLNIKRK